MDSEVIFKLTNSQFIVPDLGHIVDSVKGLSYTGLPALQPCSLAGCYDTPMATGDEREIMEGEIGEEGVREEESEGIILSFSLT
jgi:hypothetical protein